MRADICHLAKSRSELRRFRSVARGQKLGVSKITGQAPRGSRLCVRRARPSWRAVLKWTHPNWFKTWQCVRTSHNKYYHSYTTTYHSILSYTTMYIYVPYYTITIICCNVLGLRQRAVASSSDHSESDRGPVLAAKQAPQRHLAVRLR